MHSSRLGGAKYSNSCLCLFIAWNAFIWLYIYVARPKKIIPTKKMYFWVHLGYNIVLCRVHVEETTDIRLTEDRNQFFLSDIHLEHLDTYCGTSWVQSGSNLDTIWVQYGYILMGNLCTLYGEHAEISWIWSDIHLEHLN